MSAGRVPANYEKNEHGEKRRVCYAFFHRACAACRNTMA